MKLGMEVGLDRGPGYFVLDGDPAPLQRGNPQFSTHVCCGETAGWIKMPLGREVGLSPGHIVLDGDSAPPPLKRAQPQIFGLCLFWPNGWTDQDSTSYGLGPGDIMKDGDPSPSPPKKGHTPLFSAHVYCGQTVAHLSYC